MKAPHLLRMRRGAPAEVRLQGGGGGLLSEALRPEAQVGVPQSSGMLRCGAEDLRCLHSHAGGDVRCQVAHAAHDVGLVEPVQLSLMLRQISVQEGRLHASVGLRKRFDTSTACILTIEPSTILTSLYAMYVYEGTVTHVSEQCSFQLIEMAEFWLPVQFSNL